MNIGLDFTPYIHGKAPGYQEYAMSLLEGLAMLSTENTITIYIRHDQQDYFKKYYNEFNFVISKSFNLIGRLLWQFIYFNFKCRDDIVIFTGNYAPIVCCKPYVLVVHDLNYIDYPKNFSIIDRVIKKILIPNSIKHARMCITGSKFIQKKILEKFSDRCVVIYDAVRGMENNIMHTRDEVSINIVCPSSLAVHKNIPSTAIAAHKFIQTRKNVIFHFFGAWDPSDFPYFVKNDNLQIHGYVSAEHKNELFSKADCILFPSIYEGFGLPYVEAILAGKALICSDIEIAHEIIDNSAYFIKAPFNQSAVYDALLEAEKSEYAQKPLDQSIILRYCPETVAKKYLEIAVSQACY